METAALKKFAQAARRQLIKQVAAKLDIVLAADSPARREAPKTVKQLEDQLQAHDHEQVIDKVAYTWFNRLCALRFMDLKGYTRIRVVSGADEDQLQPEILADAKAGHIDEDRIPEATRQQVQDLLTGRSPSHDPDQEAYRLLLVAECNHFHRAMPYLFQKIDDYTELLMPDDLLSANSVLAQARTAMTPATCKDVEVIGWLYQFYIAEKKDEVFAALKKSKKITPQNIPAATQLFTPHWIVRYLVENSLGRLWMLNHPESSLAEEMAYYIPATEQDTDFLRIERPEDIRICDPACGSGHMLTYAFDLLYAIYEEVGTAPSEIPAKILTHNLYGIELDERAGELAAFALTMKARAKQRRFFRQPVKPNICVLEKVTFEPDELAEYMAHIGGDLFTADLRATLEQFAEADNFGSLIQPRLTHVRDALDALEQKDVAGQLFLAQTHAKVLKVLRMADYLSPTYHVVVANPPYKKKRDLNHPLQAFLAAQFALAPDDLYSAFTQRMLKLASSRGSVAAVSMDSWMFGDSYTGLREFIIDNYSLTCLAHLGPHAFPEIKGEVVQVAAFVISSLNSKSRHTIFQDLTSGDHLYKSKHLADRESYLCINVDTFKSLPRSVFAYFSTAAILSAYSKFDSLHKTAEAYTGLQTGDNDRFIRQWSEVSLRDIRIDNRDNDDRGSNAKWVLYVKGSAFRKWYGNEQYVVNWSDDGASIKNHSSSTVRNEQHYFTKGVAYNTIASRMSARFISPDHIFDQKNSMLIESITGGSDAALCLLNSCVVNDLVRVLTTKDFGPGIMKLIPMPSTDIVRLGAASKPAINLAMRDWNRHEVSLDFSKNQLIEMGVSNRTVEVSYKHVLSLSREQTSELLRIEQDNNETFIRAYSLQDELTPEVPLEEITLTCNPDYRYGGNKTEKELEALLLADTMREFCSYAVGCMFGRYSLDKPGLVLANQGDTLEEYLAQVPEPSFMPDDDNVIPMLDAEWFPDDVTERFRKFLRVTFGDEHYEENLAFVESGLNIKGKRNYSIRDFFVKEFYAYHVKLYKKRPIYWLFASPKGTFQALIYLHRYRPDTVSVVLGYLRDLRTKLETRKGQLERRENDADTSQGEATRLTREIEQLGKQILELTDYERDVLHPLASQRLEIDLDDGVKANYPKFGAALKKVPGLEAKDD